LNGKLLGHAENIFQCYRWNVTKYLLVNPSHSIPSDPHLRKAPCQFGIDNELS
jgi:hypothetical protein